MSEHPRVYGNFEKLIEFFIKHFLFTWGENLIDTCIAQSFNGVVPSGPDAEGAKF